MLGISFDKYRFEMTLSKPWTFIFIAETFFCVASIISAIFGLF